jgi:PAS domain S-box-containing protein
VSLTAFRPEQPLRGCALESANEPLFAEAFENAPHAMAIIGADGSILRGNRSMCLLLGFTSTELQRLNSADITHADDIETEAGQRRRLAAADIGRYELVQRYVRKDGENIWVRIAVAATRRSPGESPCLVAQVESVQTNHSPDSGHTHDAWLARFGEATLSAIHEIGNSLTPLMLNTEMIIEQTRRGDIRESAHQIFKAARRIAFTLRRLRGVHYAQPVAYLGEDRLLDLRLIPPPLPSRADAPTSDPPDAA